MNSVEVPAKPDTVGAADRDLRDFRLQGVQVLRGFFCGDAVDRLDRECDRLWDSLRDRSVANLRLGLRHNALGDVVLDRIDPVEDLSEVFRGLNNDPRLTSLAEALLREPVTVMKEKLLYKQPGTSGFGLHRDIDYFRAAAIPGDEVVTAAVAIDAMTVASGTVVFYPELRYRATPAPANDDRDVDEAAALGCVPLSFELDPGDVLLFDGLVPHRSDFNRSEHSRRVYYITYVPARYTQARSRYYDHRLREPRDERRDLVDGECRFD